MHKHTKRRVKLFCDSYRPPHKKKNDSLRDITFERCKRNMKKADQTEKYEKTAKKESRRFRPRQRRDIRRNARKAWMVCPGRTFRNCAVWKFSKRARCRIVPLKQVKRRREGTGKNCKTKSKPRQDRRQTRMESLRRDAHITFAVAPKALRDSDHTVLPSFSPQFWLQFQIPEQQASLKLASHETYIRNTC